MADKTVDRKLARFDKLKSDRKVLDEEYDDLARLLHPTRLGFNTDITKGGSRTDDSYDSTSAQARWQLARSTEGFVTPKGGKLWLKIELENEDLMEDHDVREWLEDATNKTHKAIYTPRARFHSAAESMYDDVAAFGSAPISMFERYDEDGVPRVAFQSLHLKNVYWALNEWGEQDTYYVCYERPAINAANQYGFDNLGKSAQDLLKNDKLDAPVKIMHVVEPRYGRNYERQDNLNMPFASFAIDMTDKKLIEESGFPELPYNVLTWGEVAGEPWGWAPGRLLLPDIKMLNQQARTTLEVGHFTARPPHFIPHEGVIDFSALHPGGWVHYDAASAAQNGGRPPIFPFVSGANYPISREMTQDTRDRIWQGFLQSVLNLPVDAPRMTATEIIERKEEMIRIVGPVFGKMETNTEKIVRRVFWVEYRAGNLRPVPQQLQGQKLKFSVNSPMTDVRKQIEAASVSRVVEIIGPLAQSFPQMMDNYDLDEIARDVGEAMMPVQWVRSRDEVETMRAQRAEAEQEAAAREQSMQVSEMARNAAPMLKAIEGGAG